MGLPTAKLRDIPSCPAEVSVVSTLWTTPDEIARAVDNFESVTLECQRVPDGHDVHGGTTSAVDAEGRVITLTFQWGLS